MSASTETIVKPERRPAPTLGAPVIVDESLLNAAIAEIRRGCWQPVGPSRPIHSDCRVEVLEFDTGIGG